jgi:hypothetical protein
MQRDCPDRIFFHENPLLEKNHAKANAPIPHPTNARASRPSGSGVTFKLKTEFSIKPTA